MKNDSDESTRPLVLIADPEPRITKLTGIALSEEGFRVVTAGSDTQALDVASKTNPDVVLMEADVPDFDGVRVMHALRERGPIRIVFLSRLGADADKARLLDLGADDFIFKPFHPDELAARLRAVLRRPPESVALVFKVGELEIDLERKMVTRGGELVVLSPNEWRVLHYLASHAGQVVLRTELLTKVWGPEHRGDAPLLNRHVSALRRKLGGRAGERTVLRAGSRRGRRADRADATAQLLPATTGEAG